MLSRTALEHNAENLNNPTLPEIKDFNALGYARCLKYFARCFKDIQVLLFKHTKHSFGNRCPERYPRAPMRFKRLKINAYMNLDDFLTSLGPVFHELI